VYRCISSRSRPGLIELGDVSEALGRCRQGLPHKVITSPHEVTASSLDVIARPLCSAIEAVLGEFDTHSLGSRGMVSHYLNR
jgi:hypothetical protein